MKARKKISNKNMVAKINKKTSENKKLKRNLKEAMAIENMHVPCILLNGFSPLEDKLTIAQKFSRQRMQSRTNTENIMSGWLTKCNANYKTETIIFVSATKFYLADFYIPTHNEIIEVDGGYHDTEEQIEKDRIRDLDLNSVGIKVIRVPVKAMERQFMEEFVKKYTRTRAIRRL